MSQNPHLPADPLNRFRDLYEALNAERGWFGDASSLRFAAMTAVSCQGSPTDVASAIRGMAEEIKRLSGWFGELNSSLRFIVSAILVLNEDRAGDFLAEVERGRDLFRKAMEDLKPKPDRSLTFNFAASIAFLELVQLDENLEAITDAKALMDMQSIISAQQAAAASSAASAAAASN